MRSSDRGSLHFQEWSSILQGYQRTQKHSATVLVDVSFSSKLRVKCKCFGVYNLLPIRQFSIPVLLKPCQPAFMWSDLRVYPQRFGEEICKLMPMLTSEGEGRPVIDNSANVPAWQLLMEYEFSDWQEAGLKSVIHYLYGNKHLKLPAEWKQCFPKRL